MSRVWLIGSLLFVACASAPERPGPRYDRELMVRSPRSRTAIHAAELGMESDGKTALVLVHPWGASMGIWRNIAPKLATKRRVLLVDLPGHGGSSYPPGRYPPRRLAGGILDAMDAAGIQEAVVVGNSIGGATTIAVAERAPERVVGMVLLGAPGGLPIAEPLRRAAAAFTGPRSVATIAPGAMRMGWGFLSGGAREETDAILEELISRRTSADWPARSRALSSALSEVMAYAPALESIQVPAMVIQGTSDRIVPESSGRKLAERLANAELVLLDGCGHCPQLDCEARVISAIEAFMERVALIDPS